MRDGAALDETLPLADEAATARLAEALALALAPGVLVALSGDLGAGKTALARALLRALADDPALEVPSPTFTLVQPYPAGRIPAAHADLYRIASPEEADELDLPGALEGGVALVEWPERGGIAPGPGVLWVALGFGASAGERTARLCAQGPLAARLSRVLAAGAFLEAAGRGTARRRFLDGDASTRRFERVEDAAGRAVLMDMPRRADGPVLRDGLTYGELARLAMDVRPFVAVGAYLRGLGLSAPALLGHDLAAGFLLLEDLGDAFVAEAGRPVAERYRAAADVLARLHRADLPAVLPLPDGTGHAPPPMDADLLLAELELYPDWYRAAFGPPVSAAERADFLAAWRAVLAPVLDGPRHLVLRDYHSPNLLWLPAREGPGRVGLIDHQDAVAGPLPYDLASLAQDARVTVPADLEAALLERYLAAAPPPDEGAFRASYRVLAAQRAMRILGTFVRLDRRDGKPRYLAHLPRLRAYLARARGEPALAPVARWLAEAAADPAGTG